ncbi:acyl-CoA dehydrogenase family protein [Candidatus Uabimicrobium amorphum]|uniref:Acyl-CoA dehydrogenase n=1 Tax=Uabimicrobium amorphum TaxID=2596890 RepID=A0A5S9F3Q1_UABAM|nr:acyl-CoA dehydrogenase family protein [Candidatus Uabimicrobium amorphum]BBM84728.1 acyl-CoA dehydrogenase [Candidatus Uabimicrobium amorphum]
MDNFFQQPPQLKNQFTCDMLLQNYLQWKLPKEMYASIHDDLLQFGNRVVNDILHLGEEAENTEPTHIAYDSWGKRIDEIRVSHAWKELKNISATEGLVAIGYERDYQNYSRLYQFAKLYLFHPSSAFFTCPLAMTDGAARVLEIYGEDDFLRGAFANLTSRDPQKFWTSGQWMTERRGGSDVSQTATTAIRKEGKLYNLEGTKWFTSATTSEMALTLARVDEVTGSKGLSLFMIELRDGEQKLQNIEVHRLKDKLGTKALPTAELSLHQTPAQMVGDLGHGVRKIASMLNITRLYNSITALGHMRRCLALAIDYAGKRKAFGKYLIDHPLHYRTLCELQTEFTGCFHLIFFLIELLGKSETNTATAEEDKLLRTLTPIAKLYSAKKAIAISSETLELFGGAGYIEDTGLPRFLRDAQVYSIWEGTTNILSLDVLRAVDKEQSFPLWCKWIQGKLTTAENAPSSISESMQKLIKFVSSAERETLEVEARQLAYSIARITMATLMVEYAKVHPESQIMVNKFCQNLASVELFSMDDLKSFIL